MRRNARSYLVWAMWLVMNWKSAATLTEFSDGVAGGNMVNDLNDFGGRSFHWAMPICT